MAEALVDTTEQPRAEASGLPKGVLEILPATEKDLVLLRALDVAPAAKGSAMRLRAAHHRAAALLAAGFLPIQVARRTGYAVSTIHTLKSNPAFKELIEHYSALREEFHGELQQRVECTALRALDEIDERLEDPDTRKALSYTHLQETAIKMLDRAGQGPVSRTESKNVNINLSPDRLGQIRRDAASIRFSPEQSNLLSPPEAPKETSEDRGASVGGEGSAGAVVEQSPADGE